MLDADGVQSSHCEAAAKRPGGQLRRPHLMAEVLLQFSGVLHFLTRMVPSITLNSSVIAT
jgi:hypothetical protein